MCLLNVRSVAADVKLVLGTDIDSCICRASAGSQIEDKGTELASSPHKIGAVGLARHEELALHAIDVSKKPTRHWRGSARK